MVNKELLKQLHSEYAKKCVSICFAVLLATSYGLSPTVALAQIEEASASNDTVAATHNAHVLENVASWEELQQIFAENALPEGVLSATTLYETQEVLEACHQLGVTLDDQLPGAESTNYTIATRDQVIPASGDISYRIPENTQNTFSRIDFEPFNSETLTQKVYFLLHLAKNEVAQQGGVITVFVFAKDQATGTSTPHYSLPISLDAVDTSWQSLVVGIDMGAQHQIESAGVLINRSDESTVVHADALSVFADEETEVCDFTVYVPLSVNNNYDSPTLIENSPYFQWSDWQDTEENHEFVFNTLPLTESDRVVIDNRILFNTQALSIAIATQNGTESTQFTSVESAREFWAELIKTFKNPSSTAAGLFYFAALPSKATATMFPTLNGGALLPSIGTIDLAPFAGMMARFIPAGGIATAPFLLGGSSAEYPVHSNYLLLPWGQFELKNYTQQHINELLADTSPVLPVHTALLSNEQLVLLRNNGAIIEVNESKTGDTQSSWLFVPLYLVNEYAFASPFLPDRLESFITNDRELSLFSYQLQVVGFTQESVATARIEALKALIEEVHDMSGNPELQQELIVRALGISENGSSDLPPMPQRPTDVVRETDENGIARDGQGIPDEIHQKDTKGAVAVEEALANRQKINEAITTALEGNIALNPEQQAKLNKIAGTTTRDVATLENTIKEIEEDVQAGEELIAKEAGTEYAQQLRKYLDEYLPRLEKHKEILRTLQDWRDLLNSGKTP